MIKKTDDLSTKIAKLRLKFDMLEKRRTPPGNAEAIRRKKRQFSRLQNQLSGAVLHAVSSLKSHKPVKKGHLMLALCELSTWGKPEAARHAVIKVNDHDMAYMATATAIGGKGGRCSPRTVQALLQVKVVNKEGVRQNLLTDEDLAKMAGRIVASKLPQSPALAQLISSRGEVVPPKLAHYFPRPGIQSNYPPLT